MRDFYQAAEDADDYLDTVDLLRVIATEARKHGHSARIVRDHVLVTSPEGLILATRSAVKLAAWLGY